MLFLCWGKSVHFWIGGHSIQVRGPVLGTPGSPSCAVAERCPHPQCLTRPPAVGGGATPRPQGSDPHVQAWHVPRHWGGGRWSQVGACTSLSFAPQVMAIGAGMAVDTAGGPRSQGAAAVCVPATSPGMGGGWRPLCAGPTLSPVGGVTLAALRGGQWPSRCLC